MKLEKTGAEIAKTLGKLDTLCESYLAQIKGVPDLVVPVRKHKQRLQMHILAALQSVELDGHGAAKEWLRRNNSIAGWTA